MPIIAINMYINPFNFILILTTPMFPKEKSKGHTEFISVSQAADPESSE